MLELAVDSENLLQMPTCSLRFFELPGSAI